MIIWGLTDGSAGMQSQVRGVGELLVSKLNRSPLGGSEFVLKTARRLWPFCLLPAACWWGSLRLKTFSSDTLNAPWPDVLITSGRRSVAFALAIKHASKGHTKLVHLQTPRASLKLFDLVVPMEHDEVSGDNIFPTFAALHHITQEKLSQAAYDLQSTIDHYKNPRIAFFIGGSTNKYKLHKARMNRLIATLNTFLSEWDGSVWMSTSRRTGSDNIKMLQRSISGDDVWFYSGGDNNPYLAWLAAADALAVTNDSVSMMSEALATGKPLYILPLPDHQNTKPARFARQLISRGMAMPLEIPLPDYDVEIHNECDAVVDEIIEMLSNRDVSSSD